MSRSMAFKRREHGMFSRTAICLMGTQKIVTEEKAKWSWGEKLGTCLRSADWIAESAKISQVLFPKWHLKFFERQKAVEEEEAWEIFACCL